MDQIYREGRRPLIDFKPKALIIPVLPSKTGILNSSSTIIEMFRLDIYPTVLVTLSGTYSGLTIKFQMSSDNGATWFGIQYYDVTDGQAYQANVTFSPVANTNYAFLLNLHGGNAVRIVATAYTSGSAFVRMTADNNPFAFSVANSSIAQSNKNKNGTSSLTNATQPILYTVTSGKTLYIKSLTIALLSPTAGETDLFDTNQNQPIFRSQWDATANNQKTFNFDPPLIFTNSVNWNTSVGTTTAVWSFQAYEL